MIGTWTTEQNWNKDNGTGLKHGTDQVCNKDTRTGLEPGEHGEHYSFRTRTRLEHGQQNKKGTWTTEQDWNIDNRRKLEQGKLEQGKLEDG